MDPDNWFEPGDDPDASMDAFEVNLRKRVLRKRVITGTLVVLGPIAVIGFLFASIFRSEFENLFRETYEVTAEERPEIERLVAEAVADTRNREEAWRNGLGSLAGLVERPDLGLCPETLNEPGEQFFQASVLPKSSFSFRWFGAGEDPTTSVLMSSVETEARGILGSLDGKSYEPAPGARLLHDARFLGMDTHNQYEVIFVQMGRKEPTMTDEVGFSPGWVTGMAYLWDHSSGEAVCAAPIHATSSDTIEVTTFGYGTVQSNAGVWGRLRADLDVETWRAIAQGLQHRAGPPLAEDPTEG